MNNMKLSIKQLVKTVLNGLDDRQRDILESRFGLTQPETFTLAAIGERYGITREGIRRIEAQALDKIKKNVPSEFRDFIKTVVSHLKTVGGVRKETELVNDIGLITGGADPLMGNYLKFFLELSQTVFYHKETDDFHSHWYLRNEDRQKAIKVINVVASTLKRGASADDYLKDAVVAVYIGISKKFSVNAYGDFGLSESRDIIPKSAKDWAYLILKKEKKPMHFSELASAVNRCQNKRFHPQTVHNELIKDGQFVLVGKGIYGLKEHGHIPGVARDVITRLIKKHGPLKSQEVIQLVLNERFFKENTVLINLQNRKYFKRLEDGRYTTLA